jgi:hypothetical protein
VSALSVGGLWLAGIAAGLTALVYLARGILNVVRTIDAIQHIVERELEHNHGGSIKDDTHGMAVAIGKLQRDRDDDRRRLNRALRLAAKHHPEDAWLYLEPEERNRP